MTKRVDMPTQRRGDRKRTLMKYWPDMDLQDEILGRSAMDTEEFKPVAMACIRMQRAGVESPRKVTKTSGEGEQERGSESLQRKR